MPLDLAQKIGQMFIWGFEGTTLSPALRKRISKYNLGGVIHFKKNIETPRQITLLNQNLQKAAKITLFISIDQEGGRVSRLGKPFTQFPAAALWWNSNKTVKVLSEIMARELALVGINMNNAPVLDINSNPKNPVIGDRAFSNNPEQVSQCAITMMKIFKKHKIISVGKHFPGHGDTTMDSHFELPKVEKDLRQLKKMDFIPFEKTIKNGLPAIMTAHVLYPRIDAKMPATFSEIFLQKILRRKMGFKGLIISDDLGMKGATDLGEISEMAIKAILAGVDILLICHNPNDQEIVFETLLKEAEKSKVVRDKIDTSLKRILRIKNSYLKNTPHINLTEIKNTIGSQQSLVDSFKI